RAAPPGDDDNDDDEKPPADGDDEDEEDGERPPRPSTSTSIEVPKTQPPAFTTKTTRTRVDDPAVTAIITDGPNDMPTLGGVMPNYPAPTVPPTQNAPYMQQSSLPEGTFFIAVGAILGFFLLSVFA